MPPVSASRRAAHRTSRRPGRPARRRGLGVALLAGLLAGASASSTLAGAPALASVTARPAAPPAEAPVTEAPAVEAPAALTGHGGGGGSWVGTWATVPTAVPASNVTVFDNQTLRQVVHVSIGGATLRVRLSNEFGDAPLVIGEAHLARRAPGATDATTAAGTDRRLTFGGRSAVVVPAGSPMLSDPVRLAVPAASDLVVSLYLPRRTPGTTIHAFPFQDNVVAAGNVTARTTLDGASVVGAWYFLTGISVLAHGPRAGSVVALGDSITDGANTTPNTNRRWPDLLFARLHRTAGLSRLGVVNEGVSGNRLLHDPNPPPGSDAEGFAAFFGHSALRRFDRDVAAQPGARYVTVLLGVNDLGHPGTVAPPDEAVTAADIIGAHRQLIARAHERGLVVIGATITPFRGDTFGFFSPEHEAARQEVNHWIRTGGQFDAVVDFDAALRDPAQPDRLLPRYDSGDHLHPNDAGTAAMAAAVPLGIFR